MINERTNVTSEKIFCSNYVFNVKLVRKSELAANSLIFRFKISSQPITGRQALSHPDKLDKEMGEKHDPFKSWCFDLRARTLHCTECFVS